MVLWLRREDAVKCPYGIDKLLVKTGLANSLTEARRLIADGGIYLNNEKLVPPEEGFLPIPVLPPGYYETGES